LRAPLRPGPATGAVVASLRQRVAHLDEDRVLAGDLEEAVEWLGQRAWHGALDDLVGALR
jgi:histidine ammonia-lyase